jgi:hypothetical protein
MSAPTLKRYWFRCTTCDWVRVYVDAPEICVKCGDVGTWRMEKELEAEEAVKVVEELKNELTKGASA